MQLSLFRLGWSVGKTICRECNSSFGCFAELYYSRFRVTEVQELGYHYSVITSWSVRIPHSSAKIHSWKRAPFIDKQQQLGATNTTLSQMSSNIKISHNSCNRCNKCHSLNAVLDASYQGFVDSTVVGCTLMQCAQLRTVSTVAFKYTVII